MATTFAISVAVFLICGVVMGISALTNRKSNCMQRGTCGGTPIEVNGVRLTCSTCPNRTDKADPGEDEGSPETCESSDATASH